MRYRETKRCIRPALPSVYVEGNMCAADALQEMLLKTGQGIPELFPTLPGRWEDVVFEDFSGKTEIRILAELQDKRATIILLGMEVKLDSEYVEIFSEEN